MDKKKLLIIILLSLIIVAGCAYLIYGLMNNNNTTVDLGTCSFKMYGQININESDGIKTISDSHHNVVTYMNSGKSDLASRIAYAGIKVAIVGCVTELSTPKEITFAGEKGYAMFTGNNITHDNILIISHSRDECIKIFESIKFNGSVNISNSSVNNISGSDKSIKSGNGTPYGYADDGSPLWTRAELEKYVCEKGGYSSLEDYYATLATSRYEHSDTQFTPTPSPTPEPSPSPSNRTAKVVK